MRYALIVITIFGALLLLLTRVVSAEEPIMTGTTQINSIPDWIMQNNPPCDEWEKVYAEYSKLATDGQTCWRYRPWICIMTGAEGVDVEHLPLQFCRKGE